MLNWLKALWMKAKDFFARLRAERTEEQAQPARTVAQVCAAVAGTALGCLAVKLLAPVLVFLAWVDALCFLALAAVGLVFLGGYVGWRLVEVV
jgi:hypothetical protein